ncbi:MAG: hypothetical protein NTU73_15025 [Ignavibacteriae bacterium]|nr:hypothetical protein [Ignavibacteriota bacterium]
MNLLDKIIKWLEEVFERSTNIGMTVLFLLAVLLFVICCIALIVLGVIWLFMYLSAGSG